MTAPDRDSIATYGGPFRDYAPVVDPTVDMAAAGGNQMLESVASMTNMCPRAFCTFAPGNASLTPSLVSHMAMWGNLPSIAPSLGRTGTGTFTVNWPTTVNDEITSGNPGFASPHTLNFLAAWANATASAAFWHPQVALTAANVATLYLRDSTLNLADPGSTITFTVFVV